MNDEDFTIEVNSAQLLRKILGCQGDENLLHAVKRVVKERDDWRNLAVKLEDESAERDRILREMTDAREEFESDDHYSPEESTLDALKRALNKPDYEPTTWTKRHSYVTDELLAMVDPVNRQRVLEITRLITDNELLNVQESANTLSVRINAMPL